MLTRIRNANVLYQEKVDVPASKEKIAIIKILKDEGYISNFKYIEDNKQGLIRIYLKYGPNKERVITSLKRISKPGLRRYVKAKDIPVIRGGLGTVVLSTPKGILSDKDSRRAKVGGEVICYVW
jgi:small subunit ribosomal protein S8